MVEIGQEGPLTCAIYFDGVPFLAITGLDRHLLRRVAFALWRCPGGTGGHWQDGDGERFGQGRLSWFDEGLAGLAKLEMLSRFLG